MTFEEYESLALQNAVYPSIGNNFTYPALGMCGEAGEYAEKVKKILRDKNGELANLSHDERVGLIKELGDVLWYITASAFELGYSLEDVASCNIEKCLSRRAAGTIHGSGDNR